MADQSLRVAITGAGGYLWLNRIVSVATAQRHPDHILYRVFEIL